MADEPRSDLRSRTTASNVLAGGLWSVLTNSLAPMLLLMQSVVAARFLGPTRMGQQSFIAWVEISTAFALSAGASGTLSRYIGATIAAERGGQMRDVLRTFTRLQLAVAVVPVILLAGVLGPRAGGSLHAAWTLAGVGAGLLVAQAVPSTVLVALQQWRQAAVISLVTGAVATGATVAVLAAGAGITGMFAVETASLAVSGVWSTRRALRAVAASMPPVEPAGPLRREVFRYAGFATVQMGFAYVVWQRSEFFFLDRYSPARQIALYSIAFASVLALQRIPEGLTQTLIPSLAVLVGGGERERLAATTGRALRLVWSTSLPLAAGLLAMGPLALRLVYGNSYRGTGPVIAILVTVLPLAMLARVGASVLHAFARVRTVLGCLATAVGTDVVVCVLLVPRHGAVGAAVANICAQAVAAGLEVLYARRAVGPLQIGWWRSGAAVLAAAACGGAAYGVVLALPNAGGLVLAVAVGIVAYGGAFVLFRPIADADLRWLEGVAGQRFGGRLAAVFRLARRRPRRCTPGLDTPIG
jgi:O-antigen/teichoic acid export membrane protein